MKHILSIILPSLSIIICLLWLIEGNNQSWYQPTILLIASCISLLSSYKTNQPKSKSIDFVLRIIGMTALLCILINQKNICSIDSILIVPFCYYLLGCKYFTIYIMILLPILLYLTILFDEDEVQENQEKSKNKDNFTMYGSMFIAVVLTAQFFEDSLFSILVKGWIIALGLILIFGLIISILQLLLKVPKGLKKPFFATGLAIVCASYFILAILRICNHQLGEISEMIFINIYNYI